MANATGLFLAFVVAVLAAVLCIVGFLVWTVVRMERRLSYLESLVPPENSSRFSPPEPLFEPESPFDSAPPEGLDDIGAWAAEQEKAGVHVSDEEIEMYRRARQNAGL